MHVKNAGIFCRISLGKSANCVAADQLGVFAHQKVRRKTFSCASVSPKFACAKKFFLRTLFAKIFRVRKKSFSCANFGKKHRISSREKAEICDFIKGKGRWNRFHDCPPISVPHFSLTTQAHDDRARLMSILDKSPCLLLSLENKKQQWLFFVCLILGLMTLKLDALL